MYALAFLCFAIGIGFPFIYRLAAAPVAIVMRVPPQDLFPYAGRIMPGLTGVSIGAVLLCVLIAVLALVRGRLLFGKPVTSSPTWDCGYSAPTARMQYTSSSFAQPLVSFFRLVLNPRSSGTMQQRQSAASFPKDWQFHSHVPDLFLDGVYIPAFRGISSVLSRLRWLQGGKVHNYVLYIALTLTVLLLWMFVWNR
jgi:hydrogenase-4 component B